MVPDIWVIPEPEKVKVVAALEGCEVLIPLLIVNIAPELTLIVIPLTP